MNELLWARGESLLLAMLVCFLGSGCSEWVSSKKPEKVSITGTTNYEVVGVLREMDLAHRKLRIAHEEIPGYMAKMTMEFEVKDASDLTSMAVGDSLAFRMVVTSEDGWIEKVQRTSLPATSEIPEFTVSASPTNGIGDMRRVRRAEPLFPGDLLPEFSLTNEFGAAMSFGGYQGQAIAFTFFFTTCPFPTMCPRMSTNLRDAYKRLKTSPDFPTNWHFFSITIDPATDTPEVLSRYAARYSYDPGHWSFLTGAPDDVEALGRHFGLQFFKESGTLSHNLRTVVINPRGKVQKVLIGNEWKPEELEEEIRSALTQGGSVP